MNLSLNSNRRIYCERFSFFRGAAALSLRALLVIRTNDVLIRSYSICIPYTAKLFSMLHFSVSFVCLFVPFFSIFILLPALEEFFDNVDNLNTSGVSLRIFPEFRFLSPRFVHSNSARRPRAAQQEENDFIFVIAQINQRPNFCTEDGEPNKKEKKNTARRENDNGMIPFFRCCCWLLLLCLRC